MRAASRIPPARRAGRRARSRADLDTTLIALVERVTRRMRAKGRVGRTVVLRVRFGDYSRATRSRTLAAATAATAATRTVLTTARELLAATMPLIDRRGLTLLGVTVSNLNDGSSVQLALPVEGSDGLVGGAA